MQRQLRSPAAPQPPLPPRAAAPLYPQPPVSPRTHSRGGGRVGVEPQPLQPHSPPQPTALPAQPFPHLPGRPPAGTAHHQCAPCPPQPHPDASCDGAEVMHFSVGYFFFFNSTPGSGFFSFSSSLPVSPRCQLSSALCSPHTAWARGTGRAAQGPMLLQPPARRAAPGGLLGDSAVTRTRSHWPDGL